MELDIRAIAQNLVNELKNDMAINKARAEGVALLYERLREAIEQYNKSGEQAEDSAVPKPEDLS
jgi:hypothetical protein